MMTGWATFLTLAVLSAATAVGVDRVRALRGRPVVIGILFGLLSIVALSFAEDCGYPGVSVITGDAPQLVAAFFFGPVAGLVTALIECLARLAAAGFGYGAQTCLGSCAATVVVALYGAGLSNWVFDGKRPPFVTAVVAAAYGSALRLSVASLFGLDHLPLTLEVVVAVMVPLSVGTGLAAGLAAAACGGWVGWWRQVFSSLNLAFFFFGTVVAGLGFCLVANARSQGEQTLRLWVEEAETAVDDQLGILLHWDVSQLAEKIGTAKAATSEKLVALARDATMDEANVVDEKGLLVASTDPKARPGAPFGESLAARAAYLDLAAGRRQFVKERFRVSTQNTNTFVKCFGVPFPTGGFLQGGYTWESFEDDFECFYFPMLEGRRLGESGFFIASDAQGRIVQAVKDRPETKGRLMTEFGFRRADLAQPPGKIFRARVFGAWSRCLAYEPIGSWRLYAVLPLAETQGPALLLFAVVALALLTVCVVFRIVLLRFQRAQAKIDELHAAEAARRNEDLRLAQTIQLSELHADRPDRPELRLHAFMLPAYDVGGDLYDFFDLQDGRLALVIADVSGKGVPAAFFMMKAKSMIRACIYTMPVLVEAVAEANRQLVSHNSAEMFVTAWIGVYDPSTGALEYVSAGHNAPLVRRADGAVEWVRGSRGAALGVFEAARYRAGSLALAPGDFLLTYTDGVTEAMDVSGALYGDARLERFLRAAGSRPVEELVMALAAFTEGAPPADDVTMLALDVKQLQKSKEIKP